MGESIREAIDTIMTSIRPQMNETHWEELEKYAQQLCMSNLTSLNGYMNLREGFNVLQKSFGQISTELELSMSQNDAPNNQDESENLYPCIIQLKGLFDVLQQQQTDEYVRSLLTDADKLRSQLFGDIHTEHIINTRYRLLAKLFHPDSVAGSELVTIFTELFQRIGQEKDIILSNLKERIDRCLGLEVAYYEGVGDLEWKITEVHQDAQIDFIKEGKVSKEIFKDWSFDQLEKAKKQHGLIAFENYRSALIALRKSANLEKSVRIRKNLAPCLILVGKSSEAEMYALGTIYIILNESDSIVKNIPHLKEIEKSLNRIRHIKGKNTNQASASSRESTKDSLTETTTAVSLTEESIADIVTRSLIITEDQRRKLKHEINDRIYDCILRGANPLNLRFVSVGIMSGRKLYKKGSLLHQEPKIRENLNKIMEEALNHFENNDYEKFFETLAKQYDDGTKQLIKFVPNETIEIQPKDVVEQLLLHEFRPDGIAYFLNIIGEALVRRKIVLARDSQAELNVLAMKLFRAIYEENVPQTNVQKEDEFDPAKKLTEEAEKLDDIVSTVCCKIIRTP